MPGTNVRPQLHLEFPAVTGAKSYHLQVSDDPQFQTLVADVRSDQPSFDLPAPADGAYWVRARAIDSLEIEGHDAVQSFAQQLAPEPPKPPPPSPHLVKVTRHDLHFEWSAEPGQQYRVQIARDAKFRRILTDQTLSDGNLTWHRPWPGRYYIRVAALPAAETPAPTNARLRVGQRHLRVGQRRIRVAPAASPCPPRALRLMCPSHSGSASPRPL